MSKSATLLRNIWEKPVVISTYCIFLVVFALFPDAQIVVDIYQTRTLAEYWSLLAELTLFFFGIVPAMIAGLAIWRQLNWGWWLAGSYLGFRLVGSSIALIVITAGTTDGIRLSRVAPDLIFQPAIIFIVSACLLMLLSLKTITQ